MKKNISVCKGRTHCDWCPFAGIVTDGNIEHCRKYVSLILGIDCKEYDLSTLKVADDVK